jgi:hypothetical protein
MITVFGCQCHSRHDEHHRDYLRQSIAERIDSLDSSVRRQQDTWRCKIYCSIVEIDSPGLDLTDDIVQVLRVLASTRRNHHITTGRALRIPGSRSGCRQSETKPAEPSRHIVDPPDASYRH